MNCIVLLCTIAILFHVTSEQFTLRQLCTSKASVSQVVCWKIGTLFYPEHNHWGFLQISQLYCKINGICHISCTNLKPSNTSSCWCCSRGTTSLSTEKIHAKYNAFQICKFHCRLIYCAHSVRSMKPKEMRRSNPLKQVEKTFEHRLVSNAGKFFTEQNWKKAIEIRLKVNPIKPSIHNL